MTALSACGAPQSPKQEPIETEQLVVPPDETVPADDADSGQEGGNVSTEEWPPAPGTPGGLPDDRTPISDAPFTPQSPQGAAQVLQVYALALEAKDFSKAYAIWRNGGKDSGMSGTQFAKTWGKYRNLHGLVGAPSKPEGAAGLSADVLVPLQIYGTQADSGERFNLIGRVTLRKTTVDGSTPKQITWRIVKTDLQPRM